MPSNPGAATAESVRASFVHALENADRCGTPYPHFLLDEVLPQPALETLQGLPFPAPELGGVSGTREAHNATRVYFDDDNRRRFDVCEAVSQAFQSPAMVGHIAATCGAELDGTFLRVEYAQDTDGFWLQPHTDIGVKRFTMLIYLSDEPGHEALGTDIYADRETWVGRSPFGPNKAMIFVPSDRSWHGFERRLIPGVRKSLIVNYVAAEWRAREQLSFPEEPVRAA
jgi:hypothetical protein